MIYFHVVSSLSTAGTLRYAINSKMLSGAGIYTIDMPGLGPLTDGVERMQFLKGLGYNEGTNDNDAFRPWQLLKEQLLQHRKIQSRCGRQAKATTTFAANGLLLVTKFAGKYCKDRSANL